MKTIKYALISNNNWICRNKILDLDSVQHGFLYLTRTLFKLDKNYTQTLGVYSLPEVYT